MALPRTLTLVCTPSQEPTINKHYDDPAGDLLIESADRQQARVSSRTLSSLSSVFRGMLGVDVGQDAGKENGPQENGLPTVKLQEKGEELGLFLQCVLSPRTLVCKPLALDKIKR